MAEPSSSKLYPQTLDEDYSDKLKISPLEKGSSNKKPLELESMDHKTSVGEGKPPEGEETTPKEEEKPPEREEKIPEEEEKPLEGEEKIPEEEEKRPEDKEKLSEEENDHEGAHKCCKCSKITQISDKTFTLAKDISEIKAVMSQYKTKIEEMNHQSASAKSMLQALCRKVEDEQNPSVLKRLQRTMFSKNDAMVRHVQIVSEYIDEIKKNREFQEKAILKLCEEKTKLQGDLIDVREKNKQLLKKLEEKSDEVAAVIRQKDKEIEDSLRDYTEMEKFFIDKIESLTDNTDGGSGVEKKDKEDV